MGDSNFVNEINKRRTFAIISHPDAGKTTITEKLLLLGSAIQVAGSVKGKKGPHATSDWMSLEQERGISITSSVMQFPYHDCTVNLLDTPGHEDFSEDTYRTLTAVDSALMIIDGAKGVEARTIKLMGVCRLRDTPIFSFVNKMDRDIRDPIDLLDEIESVLNIKVAPINWPIGMGGDFKGVYNLYTDVIHIFTPGQNSVLSVDERIVGLDSEEARTLLGDEYDDYVGEVELVRGASHEFSQEAFLAGKLSPAFFVQRLAILVCGKCSMILCNGRRHRLIALLLTARWLRVKTRFLALCSKFKPIWIRDTEIALPLCECALGATPRE